MRPLMALMEPQEEAVAVAVAVAAARPPVVTAASAGVVVDLVAQTAREATAGSGAARP